MFNGKSVKKEAEETSVSNNIIGKGTVIKGNIDANSNIRLEGKLIGDLRTKAKVACGESSVVEGNIYASNAEIAGTVKGHVEVTELLILKSTARIKGDIETAKLIIEAGAQFNGSSKMISEMKQQPLSNLLNGTTEPSGKEKSAIQ
ncbi:MAG: polymer-forming cytoskeletal protein [Cytophagales bacterium]